jgi:putative type II/III system pilus formation protein
MAAFLQLVTAAVLLAGAVQAQAQTSLVREEKVVYMDEQQSFTPGYPIGDIAIGNPDVADFKVQPGRREILLFGKGSGKTTLTVWDQQKVKRHEVLISVADRKTAETEAELRDMLKDLPGIQVRTLAGSLAITGTVTTEEDRDLVDRIATASGAQNLVRFAPPAAPAPSRGVPQNPMPQPRGGNANSSADTAPSSAAANAAAAGASNVSIEYVLDILEASVQFQSGSYATGVEPSGRSLFKRTIRVSVGNEGEVYVPGEAIVKINSKSNQKPPQQKAGSPPPQPPPPVGLRLRLRADAPDDQGSFSNYLLIETNVPAGQATDPSIMRRARWQFSAQSGEPIGVGGAELLAVADTSKGPSTLSRVASAGSFWSSLPGISSVGGASYAGSVPYYDPQTKTQLLLVVHPRVVEGR